ncbi:MAG: PAM68 family protein [Synechococcaceae cyanobacterium]|nr:PAM68 family protein [Synechococcaceae cyanobacterium]
MGRRAKPPAFGSAAGGSTSTPGRRRTEAAAPARQQAIPDNVARRMARRIALTTGLPTLLGMAVFVVSYLLVSRRILEIQPVVTLVASGGCFLVGLLGLSDGVLSASWEEEPGSLLGLEQVWRNIGRVRDSIRALRRPAPAPSGGPKG